MRPYLPIRFAVAPMIDWTDTHCRFFHRQLALDALLYTEMVVADAILHGDKSRLLGFDPAEHPLALQIGGSDPAKLRDAAQIAAEWGYDEINLNVGCPSDRVQSGAFGACLMRDPALVGRCLRAMRDAVAIPVTVKCRIGVDDQDPEPSLDALADHAVEAGVSAIWVHARKAWLKGLSPKENRDIPPLDYDRVFRLKQRLPGMFIGLNGGLGSVAVAASHLGRVDGVMMGRGAYQNPGDLANVGSLIHGRTPTNVDYAALIEIMMAYAERHMEQGGRLAHVTRHMTGLFTGLPGARKWRQMLSEGAIKRGASPRLLLDSLREVDLTPAAPIAA